MRSVLQGKQTAQKGASVRSADRGRRETVGETDTLARKSIDVRRMTGSSAVAADARFILVIRHEDEDVGPVSLNGLLGRSGSRTRQQEDRAAGRDQELCGTFRTDQTHCGVPLMIPVEADFILRRCDGRCHVGNDRKVSASADALAKRFNEADGRSITVVSADGSPPEGH